METKMTTRGHRRTASAQASLHSRREFLAALAMTSGAAALATPAIWTPVRADDADRLARHARDWAWLVGNWDVQHRRLRERLAGSSAWDEFGGKSALWLTLGGLGTIDDNVLDLPSGVYRGLGIRAFDASTRRWSIWWLDGRTPTRIDPPVTGAFDGDTGTFVGEDTFKGRPITVRFRWFDIHGSRPHWEQAFSTDRGATWEVNWRNYFTRTSATPTPLPREERAGFPEQRDWDFLVGSWKVRNRRLQKRLAGSTQWEEFNSTLVNRSVLGGFGNVGDNLFEAAGGSYRGLSVRAFNRETREWLSWWLDARKPVFGEPVRGRFVDGVGTLMGDDTFNGRPIKVRSQWSRVTPRSMHWEQAFSADGGATWETNWVSDFERG
jgi:hypothetical protein